MRSIVALLLSMTFLAFLVAPAWAGPDDEIGEVEKELAKIEAERDAELAAEEAQYKADLMAAKTGGEQGYQEKERKLTAKYMKRVAEIERKYAQKRANVLAKGGVEGESFVRKTEKELAHLEAELTRKIAAENESYEKKVAEIKKDADREGNRAKYEERLADAEAKHYEQLVGIERWGADKRRRIMQHEDKREDRPKNQDDGGGRKGK